MVVNESGLLAAMKDSYKMGGYHVAIGTVFTKKCYLIAGYGYGWAVVIQRVKMPRKVLGLLAEHIGRLPEDGEAFHCRKDCEPQEEIFDVAQKPILLKLGEAQGKYLPSIKKTRLIWDGSNVWQGEEVPGVVLMRPDFEKIVEFKDTNPYMVDNCLYVEGQVSYVLLHKTVPGETERDMVNQLGQHLWI